MLELAILGLLKEQELHGYELKKRLAATLGSASGVSFGSLYPALARLEAANAVKAVEARDSAPATFPLTGSLGGELAALRARKSVGRANRGSRGKKVYGITPRGEALFEELLAAETQSTDDDRLFNLRLTFARYLPADARLGMLERRRVQLVERLVQMRARFKAVRDGYARSLVEHDFESAEHDLSWIDRLIASERAGAAPGSPAERVGAAPGSPLPSGPPVAGLSESQAGPLRPDSPGVAPVEPHLGPGLPG